MEREAFAADEPLELVVYTPSRLGEWRFLQGAPIEITVSLVNASLRQARQAEIDAWREAVRDAERIDASPPARPETGEPDPGLLIPIGRDDLEWFSRVQLSVERLPADPDAQEPIAVLTDVDWQELRIAPEQAVEGEVLLADDPVWVSLRIRSEVVGTLAPGRYRVTATMPGADAGEQIIVVDAPRDAHERAVLAHELAKESLRDGDPDAALAYAEQALAGLEIDADVAYLTIGKAYLAKGDLQEAIAAYEGFLAAYEQEERWEDFPQLIRHLVEDLTARIEEGR
ncbi:MAG: hypothetical protein GF346_01280 [Candidatus Eisenbacteria bacterium]|nr:hypothetical protein [Candidatus Latescibacterota bacterium]MBD3301062.1 hypothetical protein [Candidatus Eisenbacteria bacterium]